jgi:hypothetical protein
MLDYHFPKIFRQIYLISLLIIIPKINLFSVSSAIGLKNNSNIVGRIYRRYHFLNHRIKFFEKKFQESICSMIMLKISQINHSSNNAKEYLNIFIKRDSIELLKQKIHDIDSLLTMLDIDLNYSINVTKNKPDINIIGPLDEKDKNEFIASSSINYYFKPRSSYYKATNILFLNHDNWTDKLNERDIIDVDGIVTRNNQNGKWLNHPPNSLANIDSNHPNLLALNRLLFHLAYDGKNKALNIMGLNYYLSESIQSDEYLSFCNSKDLDARKIENFRSMADHDLFFNFMYTKHILSLDSLSIFIHSTFLSIIQLDLNEYISGYNKYLSIRMS